MRLKRDYRSSSRKNYDAFCLKYPEISITFSKWKQILFTANKKFITHALETGSPVKLPHGFGVLAVHKWQVRSYKINKATGEKIITLPVDWKKTREEGKKIFNFNFHTTGCGYKWKWFPKMARLPESPVWVFRPARSISREITRYVANSYYAQLYRGFEKGIIKMFVG